MGAVAKNLGARAFMAAILAKTIFFEHQNNFKLNGAIRYPRVDTPIIGVCVLIDRKF